MGLPADRHQENIDLIGTVISSFRCASDPSTEKSTVRLRTAAICPIFPPCPLQLHGQRIDRDFVRRRAPKSPAAWWASSTATAAPRSNRFAMAPANTFLLGERKGLSDLRSGLRHAIPSKENDYYWASFWSGIGPTGNSMSC